MNYVELAEEFIRKKHILHKARTQKHIDDSLHGEMFVLNYIARRGDFVLPVEISNEMRVSAPRVAAALNSLESKGLITRQLDENDRRKILAGLTEKGEDIATRQQQTMLDSTVNMLKQLGEHDAKEHVRIMGRLAEMVSNKSEDD